MTPDPAFGIRLRYLDFGLRAAARLPPHARARCVANPSVPTLRIRLRAPNDESGKRAWDSVDEVSVRAFA